jgi:phage gp29-like protein
MSNLDQVFPPLQPSTDDPAFLPYTDPLAQAKLQKQLAQVIYREIPSTTISTSWTVPEIRMALQELVAGMFDMPAQLVDAIVGDDRVQATMNSRLAGILGAKIQHKLPPDLQDDPKAKNCLKAWKKSWRVIAAEPVLTGLLRWTIMLGTGLAQILWDTNSELWVPHLMPLHPRFTYYHWMKRKLMLITLDGQTPMIAGDGKFVIHAPHGEYLGWMQSSVRALAQPWIIRQFARRDWARWSEKYGLLTILAETPAGADPIMINLFKQQLAALGQEPIIQVPKGVDAQNSFGLKFLEATQVGFEGFRQLIEECDMAITLALCGQNLTTQVGKEGSFAAARIHADVKQQLLESDARSLEQTIYQQIARPFALFNFDNADFAPITTFDVTPPEDNLTIAETMDKLGDATIKLGKAGIGIDVDHLAKLMKQLGIPLDVDDLIKIDPIVSGGLG